MTTISLIKKLICIAKWYIHKIGRKIFKGRDVLDSGEATDVSFSGFSHGECHFDIRAEFDDGDVAEGYKVNLCETDSYTFTEK